MNMSFGQLYQTKYSSLDVIESELVENLTESREKEREALLQEFKNDFRPQNQPENDTILILCDIRDRINRVRSFIEGLRELSQEFGYMTPKIKIAFEELNGYERELNIRYEYYFQYYMKISLFFKQEKAATA